VAPQDSENCGRNFAKRKQSDAVFAGNRLLRMVFINISYIVINTLLGRVTLDPAGMHCPWWDDAFVSSYSSILLFIKMLETIPIPGNTFKAVAKKIVLSWSYICWTRWSSRLFKPFVIWNMCFLLLYVCILFYVCT